MKKLFIVLVLLIPIIIPVNSYAISNDYEDKLASMLDIKVEKNEINLYLFHADYCPHCQKENEFLDSIKDNYPELNIYKYEITESNNSGLLDKAKEIMNEKNAGVPFTVIGNKKYLGYNDSIGKQIESSIKEYLEIENNQQEIESELEEDIEINKKNNDTMYLIAIGVLVIIALIIIIFIK